MSMEDAPITASRSDAGSWAVAIPKRWKLWTEPAPYVVYWSARVLAALGLTVFVAAAASPQPGDVGMLLVLSALGVGQAELGRKIERMRRLVDRTPHINLTSVWTFAGVLLLPPALTFALIALLYTHLALRSWQRLRATPVYRTVINVCNVTLTCYGAYGVLTWLGASDIDEALDLGWGSVGDITAAIVTYFAIAAVIVVPGLKPAEGTLKDLFRLRPAAHAFRELFGGWLDNALEVTTLWAGALVALILVSRLPFLVIAVMLLLFFVHRGVLFRQLEALADTDEKTGLFNTRGWHALAAETLSLAEREHGRGAVLMLELDRFQEIRDQYGYLAGDEVLTAIANTLRDNIGDHDAVARFTGAEFVVLLPGITEEAALQMAEGLREAIVRLRVPVTNLRKRTEVIRGGLEVWIGVASYPAAGFAVHKVLAAANNALIEAMQLRGSRIRLARTA